MNLLRWPKKTKKKKSLEGFVAPVRGQSFTGSTGSANSSSSTRKNMRMMTTCIREIQAPISDLCGLQGIIADISEDSPIYHHAKLMNSCGLLLADMIENMRLFYTLSADLYEVERSLFVLRTELEFVWESSIEECVRLWEMSDNGGDNGKVRLQLEFGKDVPGGLVESDSTCVLRIFKSLLENAIRFTLEGTIGVEVFVETIEGEKSEVLLHFVFSDTGVGVPEEARDAIFEPLTKAHAESIQGGVGMGLAVSRAMCQVLGGNLVLEEEKLVGSTLPGSTSGSSTFHAWFPITVRNRNPGGCVTISKFIHLGTKADSLPSIDLGMERSERVLSASIVEHRVFSEDGEMPEVLLVEDVQLNRTIVSRMMRQVNVVLSTADDGLKAVEACRVKKFDVILMDISMPNMGGIEATEEIKNHCPFNKETPIIALTGTLAGKMEGACLEVGMVQCIAKPVQRKQLVESVAEHVLRKHRVWMAAE